MLEPMSKDNVDFVRQGAFIATAMVLMQQNEAQNPKVAHYRKLYETAITERREESMARYGAVLAQGIIDAGGRNVGIALLAPSGHLNRFDQFIHI